MLRLCLAATLAVLSLTPAGATPPRASIGVHRIYAITGWLPGNLPVVVDAEVVPQDPYSESYYWRLPTACKNKELWVLGTYALNTGPLWDYDHEVGWVMQNSYVPSGWPYALPPGHASGSATVYDDDDIWAGTFEFTRAGGQGGVGENQDIKVYLWQKDSDGHLVQVKWRLESLVFED